MRPVRSAGGTPFRFDQMTGISGHALLLGESGERKSSARRPVEGPFRPTGNSDIESVAALVRVLVAEASESLLLPNLTRRRHGKTHACNGKESISQREWADFDRILAEMHAEPGPHSMRDLIAALGPESRIGKCIAHFTRRDALFEFLSEPD